MIKYTGIYTFFTQHTGIHKLIDFYIFFTESTCKNVRGNRQIEDILIAQFVIL